MAGLLRKGIYTVAVLALIFYANGSRAGQPVGDSLRAELVKVSDSLYKADNNSYIIVDAIIDGFIQPGQTCKYGYKDGIVTINERPLPGNYEPKYLAKLKHLDKKHVSNSYSEYITIGPLMLSDIFDPASSLRKPSEIPPNIDTHPLLVMLANDGLADTANCTVAYNIDGFFINNERLDEKKAEKYIACLNTQGFSLQGDNPAFSIKVIQGKK